MQRRRGTDRPQPATLGSTSPRWAAYKDLTVPARRMTAAMNLAWNRRLQSGHFPQVARLRIGPIQIVHLPGEPFVQFQLHAQSAAPKSFVCVAGYGDCGVWYYGPD